MSFKNLLSISILFLPIIYGYKFYGLNFSLGFVIYILVFSYCLILTIKFGFFFNITSVYIFYLISYMLITLIFNEFFSVFYLLKIFIFFVFIYLIDFQNIRNFEYIFKKYISKISLILCVYIIIQSVFFYLLNIKLPNTFNFFVISPYLELYNNSELVEAVGILRPGSFFEEPAFFSNFIIVSICYELSKEKNNGYLIIIYYISIIISTSTAGILISTIILLFHYYRRISNESSLSNKFILYPFYFFIFSIVLYFYTIIDFGYNFNYIISKIENIGSNARFGKSYSALVNFDFFTLFAGNGVGYHKTLYSDNLKYMNDFTKSTLDFGLFFIFLFILMLSTIFIRLNKFGKYLLLVYAFKGVFSGMWFGIFGVYYLIIILTIGKKRHLLKGKSICYSQ